MALGITAFLLAGCVGDAAETTAEDAPKATATSVAKAAPPQPDRPIEVIPPDLMGKQQAEIIEILGQPVFSRRDRPALLLRYRPKGCILDLFLYPARGTSAGQAVEHIEARGLNGQQIKPTGCITSAIKSR
jgi:hypothetical protein